MFRIGLKGFIRYDGKGKLVPSSLILMDKKPDVGDWVEVSVHKDTFYPPVSITKYNRAFIRYNNRGDIVPGSLKISRSVPSIGNWLEVPMRKTVTTTSTTTTL